MFVTRAGWISVAAGWSNAEQALIQCEARVEKGEQRFYIHGPDKTLVYMHFGSEGAPGTCLRAPRSSR